MIAIDMTSMVQLASLVLLARAPILLVGHLRRRNRRRVEYEDRTDELQRSVAVLEKRCAESRDTIRCLDRKLEHLTERHDALQAQAIANRSYDEAIRMVRGGADLSKLVELCGLSPGEADLIWRLHGPSTRSTRSGQVPSARCAGSGQDPSARCAGSGQAPGEQLSGFTTADRCEL